MLESKGFALYIPGCEDIFDPFPASFDVPFGKNEFCYLEREFDRQQFCIVLSLEQYEEDEEHYSFEVYVQHNVGMGFVNIPSQFTQMTEYHFSLLYEGIRRKKL